jgi:hypothetical protein
VNHGNGREGTKCSSCVRGTAFIAGLEKRI